MKPSNKQSERGAPRRIAILGVPISVLDMGRALASVGALIAAGGRGRYVCACDVHSLMRARQDESHLAALAGASMVTPDGQPLVWTARMRGETGMARVAGPDLLPALCEHGLKHGWRHYFYGGAEGVADELGKRLSERFPGLKVAGCESPPFRPMNAHQRAEAITRINASRADIVWVGLGCPKQELWMSRHAKDLNGLAVGVGAAFDFHAGRVRRAPAWIQRAGLEWAHRLISEPGRLWRRYVLIAPRYALLAASETLMQALGRWRGHGRLSAR
jgi:N-acetylglucosaminyldiphosphoundecaprenol N-acetyl-beta-D-mannosaminyltransferase